MSSSVVSFASTSPSYHNHSNGGGGSSTSNGQNNNGGAHVVVDDGGNCEEGLDRLTPLLRTSSRMNHSFRLLTTKIHSLELLVPAPDSLKRRATLCSSTFNLIATIVGGGVLSMPLAFAKSGIILGTLLMILGGIITDLSLYLLVCCARKTGATTYGAVARHAFGPGLEFATSLIMVIFLLLLLVAFMVLVRGIWSPMFKECWYGISGNTNDESDMTGVDKENVPVDTFDNVVLLIMVIAAMPAFLKDDLYALRHCCYLSFFSISLLCVAMAYRAIERNYQEPQLYEREVVYFTTSFTDALFAYPIIALAFTSTFNIIEVHCALTNPTRHRVQNVIHGAVFWSFVLMLLFSLAGYLYAYDETRGNIVLNFDPSDPIILVGRIGCGICTLLAMPMSLLPCRDAIQALPIQFEVWMDTRDMDLDYTKLTPDNDSIIGALAQAKKAKNQQQQQQGSPTTSFVRMSPTTTTTTTTAGIKKSTVVEPSPKGKGGVGEENNNNNNNSETFALLSKTTKRTSSYASTFSTSTSNTGSTDSSNSSWTTWASNATNDMMESFKVAALSLGSNLQRAAACGSGSADDGNNNNERLVHWMMTCAILISTYMGAVLAPGVAIVWSIMGSNLAFIIQYILPAACYLKLRQGKKPTFYTHSAWALLVLSVVGAIACTIQTIWRIFFKEDH